MIYLQACIFLYGVCWTQLASMIDHLLIWAGLFGQNANRGVMCVRLTLTESAFQCALMGSIISSAAAAAVLRGSLNV